MNINLLKTDDWSTYLFYFGITWMVFMSVLDVVKPVKEPVCEV